MPEQFYEKFSGWLVAGIASLMNLLLFTWRKSTIKRLETLDAQIIALDEDIRAMGEVGAANLDDAVQKADATRIENIHAHERLFDKIDVLRVTLDETRREIKGDIGLLLDTLRKTNGRA